MDHYRGKSVNTSVPTIAVRFNATAEEIEEVYQSEDELSELTKSEQTKSTGDLEGSPLRYLPRLGKKSASTENSLTSHDSSPTTDPWKFFAGIKGKITKNIEDTITEIKHRNHDGDSTVKKTRETKDNQSDSEDISESSISKTCGAASTTEGVEMSTDEDTSSFERDKKQDENHQQSQENSDPNLQSSSALRRRIKIIKKGKNENDSDESLISVSTLGKLIELETGINPANTRQTLKESVDVESGVEALEELSTASEAPLQGDPDDNDLLPDELLTSITKNIDNLELEEERNAIIIKPVSGTEIKQSFKRDQKPRSYFAPVGFVDLRRKHASETNWYNLVYSFKRLLAVVCFIIIYIYTPIPVYYRGLMDGAITAVTLMALYYLLLRRSSDDIWLTHQPVVSQTEVMVTLPEIKEHIPINSYEGWMNEYPELYNPLTYNVSQTQSIYIRLQGNLLRISHTRLKIPKRAMWNEPKHKHVFTHHRIYNLLDAKVILLPDGLHKKRQWSKKYPICIILHAEQHNFERYDNMSMTSRPSCENESNTGLGGSKKDSVRKRHKKKINIKPQVYSKLSEELLDLDLDVDNPEAGGADLEVDDLNVLGKNLNENLLDEDDYVSHTIPEDEQQEEDVLSVDDWSMFTPLDSPAETHLYLFGRTGREKEDWFRRFTTATHKGSDSLALEKIQPEETMSETIIKQTDANAKYLQYMSQFTKASKIKDAATIKESEYLQAVNVLWLNAVIGRIIYDWSRDAGFSNALKEKIQKKLMSIKLPYFIEQLNVFQLSLGETSPLINHTGKPILDQRGLWVDLDISYHGNIVLTLQTKLNLMKLKDAHNPTDNCLLSQQPANKWQSSDIEDTAESSTDDERMSPPPKSLDQSRISSSPSLTTTKSKKLMKMVDRITESKFFQAATDNRYIKRAMEEVSNTDLSLKVEIKGLIGTLALNIPPPPSDRIWIGFRPTPKMYLSAQPIVGVRNMSFIRYLTNWIEKKLCKEFQKVMVIPNMEDFVIPNMSSELPK